jgi:putative endonuclease
VTRQRIRLGQSGETAACTALARAGYAIVAQRYRCRAGEIDIIATDGPTLAFIEVKTRLGADYGSPAEAVTAAKRHHIQLVAQDYLVRHGLRDRPCRFDVVSVTADARGRLLAEIIKGAFDCP